MEAFPSVVHWIDELMRIPAWANPWPGDALAAASAGKWKWRLGRLP